MKKIAVFCMFLFMCLTASSVKIYADSSKYNEVKQFFDSMSEITPEWENAKLKRGQDIFGYGDVKIGYIYRVYDKQDQSGYILYLDGKGIIEATWEGTDLAREIDGKVYYIFPGTYVAKKEFDEIYLPPVEYGRFVTGGSVAEILTDNGDGTFSAIVENITISTSYFPALSSNVTTTGSTYSIRKVINYVPDYTWREGCAPTSLANVIAYFDNKWHDNISTFDGPYNYALTSGVYTFSSNLIDSLANYLDTDSSGGTDQPGLFFGWEDFLDDNNHSGYHVLVGSFNTGGLTGVTNTSDYQKLISNGNPVVINVYGHSTYGNHSMTGVGYVNAYPNVNGAVVHDTWNATSKEIFLNYSELDDYYFMYQYLAL